MTLYIEYLILLSSCVIYYIVGRSSDGLAAGDDDYDDMSLYKAYETVGLLITESRIPERSVKGRRDGAHMPQNLATHKPCEDDDDEVCLF